MHFKRIACVAVAAAGINATVAAASASAATLSGEGSTLVAPLENIWATGFHSATGDKVIYDPAGSGKGIAAITDNSVDFGASDAPLDAAQQSACNANGGPCVAVPWALSATGIGYHVGNIRSGLHLTGKILAEIYLGRIKNWDSSAIKAVNKKAKLPNLTITPVFRSDGSGDTYAFTHYLSLVDGSQWGRTNYATTVDFQHGVGEMGNSGVADEVSTTNGSIGYISASYLIAQKISTAQIGNADGKFEYPNFSNIQDAASQVKHVPASNVVSIVDPSKKYKTAYPISTFTYAIVRKPPKTNAALLQAFLKYDVTTGRTDGEGLDFVPIPSVVKSAALRTINGL